MFYGIKGIGDGDFGDLTAERFCLLAERCPFYKGAMRGWIEAEQAAKHEAEEAGEPWPPPDDEEDDEEDFEPEDEPDDLVESIPMEVS